MGPLSKFYSQEIKTWLQNNPGRVVTQFQIAKLFGVAYEKAATLETAASGFRKTGIYPTDANIFGESDFAPAETTERKGINEIGGQTIENEGETETAGIAYEQDNINGDQQDKEQNRNCLSPQPGPSRLESAVTVSPKDISHVPHAKRPIAKSNLKKGKTVVLTESPYKNELLELSQTRPQQKATVVKRQLVTKNKQTRKRQKIRESVSSSEEEGNEEDTICIYCKEGYLKSKKADGWVQCLRCKLWAHDRCTGWEEELLVEFICDKC